MTEKHPKKQKAKFWNHLFHFEVLQSASNFLVSDGFKVLDMCYNWAVEEYENNKVKSNFV